MIIALRELNLKAKMVQNIKYYGYDTLKGYNTDDWSQIKQFATKLKELTKELRMSGYAVFQLSDDTVFTDIFSLSSNNIANAKQIKHVADILNIGKKLNKEEGITVILITHYMEEVIEADHVFVMDDGNLVMDGTPREVFSQVEKLKELRLDVPQATLLAYELQKKGFPLRDGILSNEELVEELCQLKLKM